MIWLGGYKDKSYGGSKCKSGSTPALMASRVGIGETGYLKAEEVQYFSRHESMNDAIPQDIDGLPRIIAELGEKGWEMVGGGPAFIYFKRPSD
jgi:hypothetical protein